MGRLRTILIVGLILTAVAGFFVWYKLFRRVPTVYADPVEHFKYGSIGVEVPAGIPYWIWVVLPRIFADKLPGPGGYVALGATWEMGQELPIGFTKEKVGIDRVGVNCAACHTATVRGAANEGPRIYLAAAANRFQPQGYVRFLFDCAHDSRFNSATIMKAILDIYDMPLIDRVLYRFVVIPVTRSQILQNEKENYYWMGERPAWGPGRTDMNPFQRQVLRLPDDHTVGTTDIMPIWHERAREGMLHHSDGLSPSLVESVRGAALAAGATRSSIQIASLDRVQAWLMDVQPPQYPFGINQALASQGEPIYKRLCADCHAAGGSRTGKVIPLAEIGTDPRRNRHWSQRSAEAFNHFADGYPWGFHQFRASDGYLSPLLDGIWLRAPFLHNGSVPSLWEILQPAASRSKIFQRGCDTYDRTNLGFLCTEQGTFRYDTSIPGNGNGGHEYGTALIDSEKQALLEYLKTF
jgi:mono/diheme cytochrome c family protein